MTALRLRLALAAAYFWTMLRWTTMARIVASLPGRFTAWLCAAPAGGAEPLSAEVRALLSREPFLRLGQPCLLHSLILYCHLRRQGRPARVVVGMQRQAPDRWKGHSWIECDGAVLFDTPANVARYARVRVYPDEPR